MSATLGVNKFSVERTGVTAEVPNNNLANLMYYLKSVFSVIQLEGLSKYTDYNNYHNLTYAEKKTVYELASKLSPSLFLNVGVFVVAPELIEGNYSNEFFKITDERIGFHVNREIMIGGRAVKVLKIMACTNDWLEKNYFSPLRGLKAELNNMQNSVEIYSSSRNYINSNTSRNCLNSQSHIISNQVSPVYYTTTPVVISTEKQFNWCKCIIFTLFCLYCGPIFWIYLCFCWDREC